MSGPTAGGEIVHATLVARGESGVLLRGASGSGKSDLALRLIEPPGEWRLVGDDQIILTRLGDRIIGDAPASIAGKLEVRGVGIIEVVKAKPAEIRLIIDLVPRDRIPRLPQAETVELLGLARPRYRLHGLDASAPFKVSLLLALVDKI